MPTDVYRDTRFYRDGYSSDEERYRRTNLRRYKVKSPTGELERLDGRYDRRVEEVDDDRRSRYSTHRAAPEYASDRPRSTMEEREIEVYREADPVVTKAPVLEAERDRDWDRYHPTGYWKYRDGDGEVEVEKRIERQPDGDVIVSRRIDEHREVPYGEVERYRKETEFYSAPDPPPAPIVIRQQAPEQRIIVQEAPAPAPIIVREEQRRDPDEYYYRRNRRDNDYHTDRHSRRYNREYVSDGDSDGEMYYRRTVVTRERSDSEHHHKRHLAEGALAGAGAAALIASRHNKDGYLPENRGRKVLAGAAIGALGTEAARRARSAFDERYEERYRSSSRSRSRSSSGSRDRSHKIKKGLGIAAAALAVAGAAKYYQSTKIDKEESQRGRSRRRYSYDEHNDSYRPVSSSRSRSRARSSSVAKMGLAAATAAGIAEHVRNKSREKKGKRSHSRLRTGAEIAAAGLAGAGVGKMMDKHKERQSRSRSRSTSLSSHSSGRYGRRRTSYSRSRSRSRSALPKSRLPPPPESSIADRKLGLVEYGKGPFHGKKKTVTRTPYPDYTTEDEKLYGGGEEYESASREARRRRRRRHKHRRHHKNRSRSRRSWSQSRAYSSSSDEDKNERSRSRSRLRNMAMAGAAAIGLKKAYDMGKNKEQKREEEEYERQRKGYRSARQAAHQARRDRERERGRYEEPEQLPYEDDHVYSQPPSPPHASGGAYYPPPQTNIPPPHMASGGSSGFMHHNNKSTVNLEPYPSYTVPSYSRQADPSVTPTPPHAPPGVQAAPGSVSMPDIPSESPQLETVNMADIAHDLPPPPSPINMPEMPPPSSPPSGSPPAAGPLPRDTTGDQVSSGKPYYPHFANRPIPIRPAGNIIKNLSDEAVTSLSSSSTSLGEELPKTPTSPQEKSVVFKPLSPRSSKALLQIKKDKSTKGHLSDEDEPPNPHRRSKLSSPNIANDGGRPPSRSRFREIPVSEREDYFEERSNPRRRRSSDPSSDRPTNIKSLRRRQKNDLDSNDDVEELPKRFDSQGHPIESSSREHIRSAWSLGSSETIKEGFAVEQIVKEVADVIEGRESWIGLVGKVLTGDLLEPPSSDREIQNYRRLHSSDSSRHRRRDHDDMDKRSGDKDYDSGHRRRNLRRQRREDDDGRDDGDGERDFGHRRKLSVDDNAVSWGSGDWDNDDGERRHKRL